MILYFLNSFVKNLKSTTYVNFRMQLYYLTTIMTEKELSPTVLENIKWLYSSQNNTKINDQLLGSLRIFEFFCQQNPQMGLIDICKFIDREYQQDIGQSLTDLKQLMAQRLVKFDITKAFKELRVQDFKFYQPQLVKGFLNVAGQ